MKIIYTIIVFAILLLVLFFPGHAQSWLQTPYLKAEADSLGKYNFYEIQKAFRRYEKKYDRKSEPHNAPEKNEGLGENEGKFEGYMQFKRWECYMEPRVYPSGDITLPSCKQQEFQKYLNSTNYKTAGSSAISFSGNWQPLGPTGTHWHDYFGGAARVSFLRIDPTNTNTMWTFAPSGGLWKTIDGGLNWTTNTDQLPIIGCTDLAIDPLNTQIMYLATGDGNGNGSALWQSSIGILKSTDGGATWPLGSNTLNWQVSWNRCIYKLLINPVNPNIVFAATSNGLYRTINAGLNWNIVQAGQFTDVEFKPGNSNVVYAVSGIQLNGTFYTSINGGSTFNATATGLPPIANVGRLEIGVTPADTNYVYVVAVKKVTNDFYGFYRSVDGGANFSFRSNTPNILAGSQAWYNLAMGVSPIHRDTILVGGTDSWKSVDGGLTWNKHTSGNGFVVPFVHPDHHDIEFLPGTDSTYFFCNDGGVWKTTDYGITWNPINEGLQNAQMYRLGTSKINPYTIITGHQDMGTHRFQGNTWDMVTQNTGDGMESIFEYDNDTIMYLESYQGRIIKTINTIPLFNLVCVFGGAGVNATGNWLTPVVMHPVFDTILLVGKAQVWRTINGGTSFSQVGNIPAVGGNMVALAYAPSNANFIYAAKANHFFVATDGNTFTERSVGLPLPASQITAIAVSNTQPEKIWVTFSGYNAANKVWASSDTGLTWSNYSTGLPNLPVNCIVYQNNTSNSLYVGTDVGIYLISDTLPSWQPFFTGLPNVEVQELEIAYGINKLRAATNGRGLWETSLPLITGTLPVEFLTFTGNHNQEKNTNDLNWTTASEINCNYFEVMKSNDSKYYYSIARVRGNGNSSVLSNYHFEDPAIVSGTIYYYLKQLDYNGKAAISNTISIQCNDEGKIITVYPNPANDKIYFQFLSPGEIYNLELFDVIGKQIIMQPAVQISTDENNVFDVSFLNSGVYLLKISNQANGEFLYGKFVKK